MIDFVPMEDPTGEESPSFEDIVFFLVSNILLSWILSTDFFQGIWDFMNKLARGE